MKQKACSFFFFKEKTAYEICLSLGGSEMCIRDRPYSGIAWGLLAEEAGIPKGVLNIVTGSASEIGGELTKNPLVKKVTFTGSTEIGKLLLKQCAGTVKKVSMELGGNAPFLVFNDADLDRAVEGAIAAKYRNSGQTCVCTNRFLVQSKIYNKFVEKFAEAASALKVGNGLEDWVQQGPLIDMNAIETVEGMIEDAKKKGGKVVAGGKRHDLGGQFFEPTVIADAKLRMRFTKEEIFGPISPIYKFRTEEEGIEMANNTVYGLAAYFYTSDLRRMFRVSEALESWMGGVNEGIHAQPDAPFCGFQAS